MPKLITFIPCERILLGATDKSISLIGVLNMITISDPPKVVPAGAQVPYRWSVFTKWLGESSDEGKTYEQKLLLLDSTDKELFSNVTQFTGEKLRPQMIHMMIGDFFSLPFLNEGIYQLVVEWKEKSVENWDRVGTYPFMVGHVKSPVTAPTP
jgi:hypothetical protein